MPINTAPWISIFRLNGRGHQRNGSARQASPTDHSHARTNFRFTVMLFFCLTSKMSHDGSWRAACMIQSWIRTIHFELPEVARGVTDPGVGSGTLLAHSCIHVITCELRGTPDREGQP